MKALVAKAFGGPEVLNLQEVTKPTPKDNEILVKVKAVGIAIGDLYLMKGQPYLVRFMGSGLFKPKNSIPGSDFSGIIESVGKDVHNFKVGDQVFGDVSNYGQGAMAEYLVVKESLIAHKPLSSSFEEAAVAPVSAVTALQAVDYAHIKAGQEVLINGASGGVGYYALQIAVAMGAEVTAVCSTRHIDMVKSLGATHVIDYTKVNFSKAGKKYDAILGVNGYQPLKAYASCLKDSGIYVTVGGEMKQIFAGMLFGKLLSMNKSYSLTSMGECKQNTADLTRIKNMFESGQLKSIIDRTVQLEEGKTAFELFDSKERLGKVAVTVL